MSDILQYKEILPQLAGHPLFTGHTALITAENPRGQSAGTNEDLKRDLDERGYKHQPVQGQYGGAKENSFLVHNPDPKVMVDLGKKYGQDSILLSDNGKHKILFTTGPNAGKYHAGTGTYGYHATQQPQDNFTKLPEGGFVRLDFDWDHLHPFENNMATNQKAPETTGSEFATRKDIVGSLGKALHDVLAKHEKVIEKIKAGEARGNEKLAKAASGCAGELPQNTYNQPAVVLKSDLPNDTKKPKRTGMSPQAMAADTEQSDREYIAQQQKKLRDKLGKADLPGAGTGVVNDNNEAWGQAMAMSEKCPSCSSKNTSPGPKGSDHLVCKDCSKFFRGAVKKSEDNENDELSCPVCDGPRVEHLGNLGSRAHFLCKGCGMSFSHRVQKQSFNDRDLEPITKSIFQVKCSKCGKEGEKMGVGRTAKDVEGLTCKSCGEKGGLKVTGKSPDLEKKGLSPEAVKSLAMKKSVSDIRKAAFAKKEIPPVEVGDEKASPGTVLPDDKKAKVIETDGSGNVTKGSDLKKQGLSPEAVKALATKKSEELSLMNPGSTSNELGKSGLCPTCGSKYAGESCKECVHSKLGEGLRSQVTEKDRKANIQANVSKWNKEHGGKGGFEKQMLGTTPAPQQGAIGVMGKSGIEESEMKKAGIYLQKPAPGSSVSEHKVLPRSSLPAASQLPKEDRASFLKGVIARHRAGMSKTELAKVAPPGEEKLVHKLKDEYGHDKAGKEKAFATAWSIHNKKVDKAEMSGVPKAPSAGAVKAPGVKQSNPTAPKLATASPKTQIVPKVQ
jgi:transposase-like protein